MATPSKTQYPNGPGKMDTYNAVPKSRRDEMKTAPGADNALKPNKNPTKFKVKQAESKLKPQNLA